MPVLAVSNLGSGSLAEGFSQTDPSIAPEVLIAEPGDERFSITIFDSSVPGQELSPGNFLNLGSRSSVSEAAVPEAESYSAASTTAVPASAAQTTAPASSVPRTTAAPTTSVPTVPKTTVPQTTVPPVTAAPPTTAPPAAESPVTAAPTTAPPVTEPPATDSPAQGTIFGQPYLAEWPSVDMWDRMAVCESGGNWSINIGNGYYGGLQFAARSWESVGGSGFASDASREEQIYRGNLLWERRGWNAWPGCKRDFGWDREQTRQ
jgi:hypothetical protein